MFPQIHDLCLQTLPESHLTLSIHYSYLSYSVLLYLTVQNSYIKHTHTHPCTQRPLIFCCGPFQCQLAASSFYMSIKRDNEHSYSQILQLSVLDWPLSHTPLKYHRHTVHRLEDRPGRSHCLLLWMIKYWKKTSDGWLQVSARLCHVHVGRHVGHLPLIQTHQFILPSPWFPESKSTHTVRPSYTHMV